MQKRFTGLAFLIVILLAACTQAPAAQTNRNFNAGRARATATQGLVLPASGDAQAGAPTETSTAEPTSAVTPAATDTAIPLPAVPQTGASSLALTSVQVDVSSALAGFNYDQSCAATYNFTANLTTDGAGAVTYYWLRSNGSKTPNATLQFTGANMKTVTDSWVVSGATEEISGWDRLYIVQPAQQPAYTTAAVSLSCAAPVPTKRPALPGRKP